MINMNITNFRKNIYDTLEQTIKYNELVQISTKDGNAVVMSEEDYAGLMATVQLSSIPQMRDKIVDGLKAPLDECVNESEVNW